MGSMCALPDDRAISAEGGASRGLRVPAEADDEDKKAIPSFEDASSTFPGPRGPSRFATSRDRGVSRNASQVVFECCSCRPTKPGNRTRCKSSRQGDLLPIRCETGSALSPPGPLSTGCESPRQGTCKLIRSTSSLQNCRSAIPLSPASRLLHPRCALAYTPSLTTP